jgi:prophage regulatory protein
MEIYRFFDLKRLGIVNNRMTLRRWIATESFPKSVQLGPNSVGWLRVEVDQWVVRRAAMRQAA